MAERVVHMSVAWGSWPSEPFLEMLQERCAERKLKCVVCGDGDVRRMLRALETGRARILVHLDSVGDYADSDSPYTRLGYAAKDAGAFVINEPDAAKPAENKAIIHYQFVRAGIPVPFTVVVRNWKPAKFKLTAAQRRRLGRPFIMKPARGYGKQGVAEVEQGSLKEMARARRYDRGDDFLLQEFVEPVWFGHRMGWFRVFYLLGEVTVCWWDTATQHYAPVGLDEFSRHGLAPLLDIARKIAQVSGMNYFSTEVAAVGKGSKRRFLTIDYINDPCDMTVQSFSHSGVPDCVVEHVAERLAEVTWRVVRGGEPSEGLSLWLAR